MANPRVAIAFALIVLVAGAQALVRLPHREGTPRDEVLLLQKHESDSYVCPAPSPRDFTHAFALFAAVPPELGDVLELGYGPEGGVLAHLHSLQPRTSKSHTVVASACEHRAHDRLPHNVRIHEYEELGSRAQFDTVLTIHALDRCNDALRALRNMYGALRPGGVLVLYDRVYVGMARTVSPLARALPSKDAHQLSVGPLLFDQLLSRMETMYQHTTSEYVVTGGRVFRDVAIIARKPKPVSMATKDPLVMEDQVQASQAGDMRYFLIWTTDRSTFGPLCWRVLETLFATVPGCEVFVYANGLPADMFSGLHARGFKIHLIRYDPIGVFDGTPLHQWGSKVQQWQQGGFFYSHYTDALRVALLWKYGGIYIDFDVLVLKDLAQLAPNSFGTEHPIGAMPTSAWQWPRYYILERPNLNLAVAKFKRHAPFLNYIMLQFDEAYDHDDWGCVGPDFVTRLTTSWARLSSDNVIYNDHGPQWDNVGEVHASTIIVYTDPIVLYPVGWTTALDASRSNYVDEALLARVAGESFAVHVYTNMYRLANMTFTYEDGSLLHHILSLGH